jgi:CheY-like chemotaxis protein
MLSFSEFQHLAGPEPTRAISKRTRILIADDDPDTLELLAIAVEGDSTDIYMAVDGGELLELVADSDPFDLIVTDINMPWIEGLQVLASMREAGLDTPVLVVTGFDRRGLAETIARLGKAMLLRKPFEIAELRRAIAALLVGAS